MLGILLIVAVSIVPMKLTKTNMFGGDGGERDRHLLPVEGQPTPRSRCRTRCCEVENYLDANRKQFHIKQIYSCYSEQGWADTVVTFDSKDAEGHQAAQRAIRKELPKSARADDRRSATTATTAAAQGKNVQVQLVGDSTADAGRDLAEDIVPMLAQRKELRDVRVDAGDQNSELTVRVDRERAAAFGFSAEDVSPASSAWPCAARRCASSAAATPRCRCGCASPAPSNTASRTSPAFTVRAPDGRTVPLLAWSTSACGRRPRRSSAPTARPR